MNLTEIKSIINQLSNLPEDKLEEYVQVRGFKQGLHELSKGLRSLELYGKTATVKKDSVWIYAGHTFPIKEIYILHDGKYRVYERGSMDLRLDLTGTKFEYTDNPSKPEKPHHRTSTVINTKDLIIND